MRGRGGEEKGTGRGGKESEGRLPPLKFKSGYALGLRVMSVNYSL